MAIAPSCTRSVFILINTAGGVGHQLSIIFFHMKHESVPLYLDCISLVIR